MNTARPCCRYALDVTDHRGVFDTVAEARDRFGKLDVRGVNNTGYGQFGMIEELSEQEAPRGWRLTSSVRCG